MRKFITSLAALVILCIPSITQAGFWTGAVVGAVVGSSMSSSTNISTAPITQSSWEIVFEDENATKALNAKNSTVFTAEFDVTMQTFASPPKYSNTSASMPIFDYAEISLTHIGLDVTKLWIASIALREGTAGSRSEIKITYLFVDKL